MRRWLFNRRRTAAQKAWAQYREIGGEHLPVEPPTLFLAGFSMGISLIQNSYPDGPDEASEMAGAGRN